jgi:hypothetical protein
MSWKRWPKNSKRRGIVYGLIIAGSLWAFAPWAAVAAPDKLRDLQANFDHDSHASTKIKLLEKLGEAQFAAASSAQKAGNYSDIGLIFEKYRDNVRAAHELLKQQDPNVDKHSQGYRHLELQARRGIREVEDILIIVPEEVRPPLQIVRGDLIQIDDELIHALFPRRTKDLDKTQPAAPQASPPASPAKVKP